MKRKPKIWWPESQSESTVGAGNHSLNEYNMHVNVELDDLTALADSSR